MERIESRLKKFRKKYSIEYLKKMNIDDYVIGNGRKDTFCYEIEHDLIEAGDIRGSNAKKFGVYFGKYGSKKKNEYVFANRFNNDFFQVRDAIVKLVEETMQLTKFVDIKSEIHGMFKYKIMFIYNPDIMIPSYTVEDMKHFAEKLDIKCGNDYVDYQKALLDYKKRNHSEQTNLKFMRYLYKNFGKPLKHQDIILDNNLNEETYYKALKENEELDKGNYAIDKNKKKNRNGVSFHPRNPKQMRIALQRSNGKCAYNEKHKSFIRKNGTVYLECHHLIPMSYYDEFDFSIDVAANIVCLCSECHNRIHYGKDYITLVKELFKSRKNELKQCRIKIEEDDLIKMYENTFKLENIYYD